LLHLEVTNPFVAGML